MGRPSGSTRQEKLSLAEKKQKRYELQKRIRDKCLQHENNCKKQNQTLKRKIAKQQSRRDNDVINFMRRRIKERKDAGNTQTLKKEYELIPQSDHQARINFLKEYSCVNPD